MFKLGIVYHFIMTIKLSFNVTTQSGYSTRVKYNTVLEFNLSVQWLTQDSCKLYEQ